MSRRKTGQEDPGQESAAGENNNPTVVDVEDEEERERIKHANIVDTYARLLFPLCYVIYNIGYWVVFLS